MPSMTTLVVLLSLMTVSTSYAIDYDVISENIRSLTKDGKLKQAYQLSAQHEQKSDVIAMQYAQIALLVGEEDKGRELFQRLAKSSSLTETQKKNMDRFVSQFDLSLKKRLRKADQYADRGKCSEANLLYRNLLQYNSTKQYAKKALNQCHDQPFWKSLDMAIKGRTYYKLGYDSNVSLDNEDLLSSNENILSDQYQKLYGLLKNDVDSQKRLWIQGALSAYQLDYISESTQAYDQLSLKAGLTLGGKLSVAQLKDHRFSWRIPVSYRRVSLDDDEYTDYLSIKGRVEHGFSMFNHSLEIGFQDKSYLQPEDTGRDGEIRDVAYGWRYKMGVNRFYGRILVREFTGPQDKSDAYTRSSVQLGWNRRLPSDTFLFGFKPSIQISYLGSETSYDGIDEALVSVYGAEYDKIREDTKHKLSAELKFVRSDWQVSGAFHHQQRDSNLPTYQYNRNTTEFGIQYRF